MSVCRSVGWSVGRSVGRSVSWSHFTFFAFLSSLRVDKCRFKRGYFSSQYLRLYHFGFFTIDDNWHISISKTSLFGIIKLAWIIRTFMQLIFNNCLCFWRAPIWRKPDLDNLWINHKDNRSHLFMFTKNLRQLNSTYMCKQIFAADF